VTKCQAVISNHYFDIMVWFQCTHFGMRENHYMVNGHAKNLAIVEVSQNVIWLANADENAITYIHHVSKNAPTYFVLCVFRILTDFSENW